MEKNKQKRGGKRAGSGAPKVYNYPVKYKGYYISVETCRRLTKNNLNKGLSLKIEKFLKTLCDEAEKT